MRPPPTAPPRPSRTRLYLGVVVAVAIAVLLVAIFVVPLLTTSSSGGSSTEGATVLTYSQARQVADRTAGGFQGGGWTLLFAVGLDSATSELVPANTTVLDNTSCLFTPTTGVDNLSLPGYVGNRSSGLAPAWEFGYRNSSYSIAIVSVINGQGTVLGSLSGSFECLAISALLKPVPGNAIDSSQAAAAVEPQARTFLAAHPNASAEFGLIGGLSFEGVILRTEWSIMYNTCPLSPTDSGTGVEFNATVNATTGEVLSTNTTEGVSCGSTIATSQVASSPAIGSSSVPSLRERSSVPS